MSTRITTLRRPYGARPRYHLPYRGCGRRHQIRDGTQKGATPDADPIETDQVDLGSFDVSRFGLMQPGGVGLAVEGGVPELVEGGP